MTTRRASCTCGQLHLETTGEPVRVSVCHCLDCQRRTGSAFAAQARFHAITLGSFADPTFPAPTVSVYEKRRHPWVKVLEGMDAEHWD